MIFDGEELAGNNFNLQTMKLVKEKLLQIINKLLSIANLKLVKCKSNFFDMQSGLIRLQKHNHRIRTVIDIGASDGSWSKGAMKYFPNASFVAIEPLQEREKLLRKIADNHSNFIIAPCVAGENDNCKATLSVSDDLDGSTITDSGDNLRRIDIKTIDTIIAENALKGPFLLKFDTHGYELPILKGAMKTIKETYVVIMEVYNFDISETSLRFHEMCEHMEKLGFRCFDIVDLMLREHDKAFWQMDLFFCRKDNEIFRYKKYK